jgi:hypothetical protein
MNKTARWTSLIVGVLVVLWAAVRPVFSDKPIPGVFAIAMSETKQVGLAAKLYAGDHQGRLPQSLDELAPSYLPDEALLPGVMLATPRAVLSELSPDSTIMLRIVTDNSRKKTRVVVVHPDISVECKRP